MPQGSLMEYVCIAVWPKPHILFIDEAIQPAMSIIAEDEFSIKIRIIFKLLLSLIHEHMTLPVDKRLQFLREFDFVRILAIMAFLLVFLNFFVSFQAWVIDEIVNFIL